MPVYQSRSQKKGEWFIATKKVKETVETVKNEAVEAAKKISKAAEPAVEAAKSTAKAAGTAAKSTAKAARITIWITKDITGKKANWNMSTKPATISIIK